MNSIIIAVLCVLLIIVVSVVGFLIFGVISAIQEGTDQIVSELVEVEKLLNEPLDYHGAVQIGGILVDEMELEDDEFANLQSDGKTVH